MKPHMHLLEIIIFSLYHVIIRPHTESRQKLDIFTENKVLKKLVSLFDIIQRQKKNIRNVSLIFNTEKFEKSHFGRSDDDLI